MLRRFAVLAIFLWASTAQAAGLLIPSDKKLPPLAMLDHQATISIDEQVAVTRIEQTFRNHTDRQLEATYLFPVPKGASVRGFSMWVDGKEQKGELLEADKARQIYTDIVRRTLDPGLLEYMDNSLLKLRVFPVPPKGDQKISITYTSVANADHGVIEYVYPMKTDGKAASTLEKFSLRVEMKSQHPIQNLYSPSHAITIGRTGDRQATIGFEKNEALLDRDFQLFYTLGTKDVGLNSLAHRPSPGQNGWFMFLVAPRAELSKEQQVPRDMVFVIDTSGSMRGKRIAQARNAMQYCLKQLQPNDRFAMIHFATTVNRYNDGLIPASSENLGPASKWVEALETTGGTAINDALAAAMAMRSSDESRPFTVVFFTDGRPTIGETNGDNIVKNVMKKNSSNTRIFTFGVGDDVNASMLDKLADETRAVCTYVRESEDIEAKVSSLYGKISNPVLANLKLSVSGGISLSEVYPPQLPDLFHGSQLVVLGRYTGSGHGAVKLVGNVGKDEKEFVYETNFPAETSEPKPFVEDLWARRKVGFLLDQIRINGEKKELIEEVVTLAKKYGITTPYTSYLVVPDNVPVAAQPRPGFGPAGGGGGFGFGGPLPDPALPPMVLRQAGDRDGKKGEKALPLAEVAKQLAANAPAPTSNGAPGEGTGIGAARGDLAKKTLDEAEAKADNAADKQRAKEAREQLSVLDQARRFQNQRNLDAVQSGNLGVNLSVQNAQLKNQVQTVRTGSRNVQSRNLIDLGGVWIDDAFEAKMETVTIKAQSAAYFRLLERQPTMRDVYSLGNHVVWVTPSGVALIIDQGNGAEEMPDADLDRLFAKK